MRRSMASAQKSTLARGLFFSARTATTTPCAVAARYEYGFASSISAKPAGAERRAAPVQAVRASIAMAKMRFMVPSAKAQELEDSEIAHPARGELEQARLGGRWRRGRL